MKIKLIEQDRKKNTVYGKLAESHQILWIYDEAAEKGSRYYGFIWDSRIWLTEIGFKTLLGTDEFPKIEKWKQKQTKQGIKYELGYNKDGKIVALKFAQGKQTFYRP